MIETIRTFIKNCFFCCQKSKLKIDDDLEKQQSINSNNDSLFTDDTDEDFLLV